MVSQRLAPSGRSTLRRHRERGTDEVAAIHAILDEALVAHVGFAADHGPVVLPMTYARLGDSLYLHGASGNDLLRHVVDGTDLCVTVTLLDGLVFARSAFHHSMNYRCVVLFGRATKVTDVGEMQRVSAALVDHLAPGRSADARPPTDAELRATMMVRLPIDEGSAKVRSGGPVDDEADLGRPCWAGELPVGLAAAAPVPHATSAEDPPAYVIGHRLASTAARREAG